MITEIKRLCLGVKSIAMASLTVIEGIDLVSEGKQLNRIYQMDKKKNQFYMHLYESSKI